jgi:hypothetical protein
MLPRWGNAIRRDLSEDISYIALKGRRFSRAV